MTPLESVVETALAAADLGPGSVVLSRIDVGGAGRLVSIRAEAPLSPASMIKVPIAAALAARWASGAAGPADQIEVTPTNLTANDAPSPFVAGYRARLEELATLMLARSDNVATNVLIEFLGRERITEYCRTIGLEGTVVRRKLSGSLPLIDDPGASGRNAHPAADAARLFEAIAQERIPGSAWLLRTLATQEWNNKLSGGLRAGDAFAHKTGDTDEVSHDGGILRTPEGARYVVVVYTSAVSPDGDDPRFAQLMRTLRAQL